MRLKEGKWVHYKKKKKEKGAKSVEQTKMESGTNWEELKKYNHKNSHTDTIVVLALFQSPQH